jgi:uncharacterized phiE125 gp8 family phage protein
MSDLGDITLKLDTAPAAEPVTLAEVKSMLRITDTADDDLINILITAAREVVEKFLNRALINQTWVQVSDSSPRRFTLPYPPLQSVTSITSYDEDDTGTVNSSANYITSTRTDPGYVILKNGSSWVDHRFDLSFEVKFVAGYGAAAANVPQSIRQGIRVMDKDVMGWLQVYRAFVG